jgi:hypothetical protein
LWAAARSFDKDIVLPASTIVTHDDKHWLYYAGANERHGNEQVRFDRKHAIGLATLRLDGFVGLRAGETAGTIVTKPFRLEGQELMVNVDARDGQASVEVLDETGQPLPGYARRRGHRSDETGRTSLATSMEATLGPVRFAE